MYIIINDWCFCLCIMCWWWQGHRTSTCSKWWNHRTSTMLWSESIRFDRNSGGWKIEQKWVWRRSSVACWSRDGTLRRRREITHGAIAALSSSPVMSHRIAMIPYLLFVVYSLLMMWVKDQMIHDVLPRLTMLARMEKYADTHHVTDDTCCIGIEIEHGKKNAQADDMTAARHHIHIHIHMNINICTCHSRVPSSYWSLSWHPSHVDVLDVDVDDVEVENVAKHMTPCMIVSKNHVISCYIIHYHDMACASHESEPSIALDMCCCTILYSVLPWLSPPIVV